MSAPGHTHDDRRRRPYDQKTVYLPQGDNRQNFFGETPVVFQTFNMHSKISI